MLAVIIRYTWHYWGCLDQSLMFRGGFPEIASYKNSIPDKFRRTTGLDQAFDPIVLVGKSAVNHSDNPLAYFQLYLDFFLPFYIMSNDSLCS